MFGITRSSEIKKFLGNEWKDEYNDNKSALKKLYKLKPEKFEILSKSYDISSTNKKDVMIYL